MTYKNINFVDILVDTYNKIIIKNQKFVTNKKYSIREYIDEILYFIQNSVLSWNEIHFVNFIST